METRSWVAPRLIVITRGSRDELVLSVCKLYSGGPPWPPGPNDAAISCQVKNFFDDCVQCSELGSS